MGRLRLFAAVILAATLLLPGMAGAQESAKTFAVLPFTINGPDKYQYLSRGIQDMLISRLTWDRKFLPMDKEKVAEHVSEAPGSDSAAATVRSELGVDQLVWGSVTILGDQCSVDVRSTGADGTLPKSSQTTVGGLIPTLETISKSINAEVFERKTEAAAAPDDDQRVNRMNPNLVHNERDAAQEFYLNPQFRYQGGTDNPGRWRSPSLKYISRGMVVGDADADGVNEIFVLGEHTVYAYRTSEGQFQPMGEINPGTRVEMLNINLIDTNRDGRMEIVVSGIYDETPQSYILNYENGNFTIVSERIRYFLNVVNMPPTYQPVLVGQRPGRNNVLSEEPIHEVVKIGGEYQLGKRVPLPDKANVFNFAYLPEEGTDYKLLLINSDDHIEMYSQRLERMASTMEQFGGSALGFEVPDTMAGFSTATDQFINVYYIPLRMVVSDVDSNGTYEVLVNKNISLAAQFFDRYRFFPNGEIHALFWDGVGLSLAWKTRRIKGTVSDYGLGDIDNDGVLDLYVCLNTYPGPTGMSTRKTMILAYSLDTEMVDAPVSRDEQ